MGKNGKPKLIRISYTEINNVENILDIING